MKRIALVTAAALLALTGCATEPPPVPQSVQSYYDQNVKNGKASALATRAACTPQLQRTATAITGSPKSVKVAILGDSTRDEDSAGLTFVQTVRAELPSVPAGNVVSFGKNGATLTAYTQMESVQAAILDFKPTVIELSIGINDLRLGQAPELFTQNLEAYLSELHTDIPGADIIISVPGALSTRDIGGNGYVKGSNGAVNPAGAAQAVTTELRAAYLTVAGKLDYVALVDAQEKVTGTDADASEAPRFVTDQLHPNAATSKAVAKLIAAAVTCA